MDLLAVIDQILNRSDDSPPPEEDYLLGLPAIWIPHSYAACSQHAPDEHILMSLTRTALPVMVGLYWDLGDKTLRQDR